MFCFLFSLTYGQVGNKLLTSWSEVQILHGPPIINNCGVQQNLNHWSEVHFRRSAIPLAGAFFSTACPWTVLKSGQTILGLALAASNPAARPLTKALIQLALHGPPYFDKLSFVDVNDDES
jgi:hypothetical protein